MAKRFHGALEHRVHIRGCLPLSVILLIEPAPQTRNRCTPVIRCESYPPLFPWDFKSGAARKPLSPAGEVLTAKRRTELPEVADGSLKLLMRRVHNEVTLR